MRSKRRRRAGIACIAVGVLLLGGAALLVLHNRQEERTAGELSQQVLEQLEEQIPEPASSAQTPESSQAPGQEVEVPNYVLDPGREMPEAVVDTRSYIGVLRIPALGLSLPVISEWSDSNLKVAPCRYSGSAYQGGLVIAGHNYRTHFAGLTSLETGDQITFTDMDGNVFLYEVAGIEILQPTDVEDMISDAWDLTLFTCDYSGQARVTVRCIAA